MESSSVVPMEAEKVSKLVYLKENAKADMLVFQWAGKSDRPMVDV